MKFISTFSILGTILISIAFSPPSTFAAALSGCQPLYGGNKTCQTSEQLTVNSTITHPTTNNAIDHASTEEPFQSGQEVRFTIDITNTHNQILKDIKITNILPSYIVFVSGDGDYETKTNELTTTIKELQLKETKRLKFSGKVVSPNSLPDQSLACVVNQSVVNVGKEAASDNNLFCIRNTSAAAQQQTKQGTNPTMTKGGLLVHKPNQKNKKTPDTGPETLALFGLIPAGTIGWYLRKKQN